MDIDIKLVKESGELGPQRNPHGHSGTREVVTEVEVGRSIFVTLRVRTVQYGSFQSQPAALIVFDFILRSPTGSKGIRGFNVRVRLRHASNSKSVSTPRVLFLAPEDYIGSILGTDHPSDEVEGVAEISGWKTGSDGQQDNVAVWDCPRSESTGKRIARRCNNVIIVGHDSSQSFQADVDLHLDHGEPSLTKKVLDYYNWIGGTEKDDPLLFDPTKSFGSQYQGIQDFQDLDLQNLIHTYRHEAGQTIGKSIPYPQSSKEQVNQSDEKSKYMAIRVMGIPSRFTTTEIQQILNPLAHEDFVVKSLATDIGVSGQTPPLVATITSSLVNEALSHLQSSSSKRVEYNDSHLGRGHVLLDRAFLGLTVLYDPDTEYPGSCLADLVAVHGLNGHPFGSWRAKDGFMWLRDGLPKYLSKTRILIYGHDTSMHGSASFADMSDHGRTLLQWINLARPEAIRKRPLIVLGQSLGGLLIKQAIVQDSRMDAPLRVMTDALKGMCLLGTPHRGLKVEHLLAMVEIQPNEDFIRSLAEDSPSLRNLHDEFVNAVKDKSFAIYSWYERLLSPTAKRTGDSFQMTGPPARLVSEFSATNAVPWEQPSDRYPMQRTHSMMAKLEEGSSDYSLIIGQLAQLELAIAKDLDQRQNQR